MSIQPSSERNQSQVTPLPVDSPPEQAPVPYWQRQPGESLLWYNRFKLYRGLGYKRSLVAALEKERETAQVLKSPKTAENMGTAVSMSTTAPKRGSKKLEKAGFQEVPKPVPAQVPGSWKQASIKYHWVERAAAYDEYRIDKMVERDIDDLLEGPALALHRVAMLKGMLEVLRTNLSNATTFVQMCMTMARMQSIMKQIAEEMASYDESVTRSLLRHMSTKAYREWDPKKIAEDLTRKADSKEQLLATIEQEERRRAQAGLRNG